MHDLKRKQKNSKKSQVPEIAMIQNATDVFAQVTRISVECSKQTSLEVG